MTFIKNNCYILFIFALCIGFALIGISKQENIENYKEITIYEGDTLWGLATIHAENMSKDEWIKKVVKLNDLASVTIQKGDSLRLPVIHIDHNKDSLTHIAGDSK